MPNDPDWKEKCKYGVERSYATQHGKCASCVDYSLSQAGFPNKCLFRWKDQLAK